MRNCIKCEGKTKKGLPCKNNTCLTTLCWVHSQSDGLKIRGNKTFRYRVKKSLIPNSGYGLFTLNSIKKGETFGIYSGALEKFSDYGEEDDGLHEYSVCNVKGDCVNSYSNTDYPGRFANTCGELNNKTFKYKKSMCNMDFTQNIFKDGKKGIMNMRATKNIKPNEEMIVNYGNDYWINRKDLK